MGGNDEEAYDEEKPIHEVTLSSFYIGKFPVTQALWKAVMNDNPSSFKGDTRPVEAVSWRDAQAFVEKLNELTGKLYRLPTEAEWEYAARGGQHSERHKYAGSGRLDEVGWYRDNSYGETKPVEMKAPNELGLYDISGNVWEWCWDWFDEGYYGECHEQGRIRNPKGAARGAFRVLRGGAWSYAPQDCRCGSRILGYPWEYGDVSGFRMVLPFQFIRWK